MNSNSLFPDLAPLVKRIKSNPKSLMPLAIISILLIALYFLENDIHKNWDTHVSYYVLLVTFLTGIISLAFSFKDISAHLKNQGVLQLRIWIIPALIAVVSTVFISKHIEATHRIQSDEAVLLATSQNYFANQYGGACDQGYFDQKGLECTAQAHNFKTKAVPFLNSIAIFIFGDGNGEGMTTFWVFGQQLVLYPISIILMFLAIRLWTRNSFIAGVSSAFLASHPTVMFQFRSASVEPLYIFLALAGLIFLHLVIHFDKKNFFHTLLLSATLAFLAQTRQESLLCLGAFFIPVFFHFINRPRLAYIASGSAFLFLLPVIWVIFAYRGYNFQGGDFSAHGHLFEHLKIAWNTLTTAPKGEELVLPFIQSHAWSATLGYFALLWISVKKDKIGLGIFVGVIGALVLGLSSEGSFAFAITTGFILSLALVIYSWSPKNFFASSLLFILLSTPQFIAIFENVSGDMTININQRYSLVFLPILSYLAAIGIYFICYHLVLFYKSKDAKVSFSENSHIVLSVLFGFLILSQSFQYQKSFEKNIMYKSNHLATEEAEIRGWLNEQTPKRRLFIYGRPWHFIAYGHSANHYVTWTNFNKSKKDSLVKAFEGEVYYVRGMDCWDSKTWHKKATESRQPQSCNNFEKAHSTQQVFSKSITGSYTLKISKLKSSQNATQETSAPHRKSISYIEVVKADFPEKKSILNLKINITECKSPSIDVYYAGISQVHKCQKGIKKLTFKSEIGLNKLDIQSKRTGSKQNLLSKVFLHPGDRSYLLAALNPTAQRQGWGELGINQSNDKNPLRIAGQTYFLGLGAHAPSFIEFDIPKGFNQIQFAYGLDDEEVGGDGAKFKILLDNKEAWSSEQIQHKKIYVQKLKIGNAKKLRLVTEAGTTNHFDHTDWILPVLIK